MYNYKYQIMIIIRYFHANYREFTLLINMVCLSLYEGSDPESVPTVHRLIHIVWLS